MTYLLDTEDALLDAVSLVVDRAAAAGMAASAIAETGGGARVAVRNGLVDTAVREGSQSLTVTVFADGRSGSATTGTLDREELLRAVDAAITIARLVEPDTDNGLADPDLLAQNGRNVALFASDPAGPGGLVASAEAIHDLAQGDAWRVTGAGAASSDGAWALATSHGFARSSRFSHQHRWCEVIAPDRDTQHIGYAASEDRRVAALDPVERITRRAIERALAARGGHSVASCRTPVLFEPQVATVLLGDLIGALSGGPQSSGATFFPSPIGTQVAADHLDLREDPFEPFGLASAPFDREGVAGTARPIVEGGVACGLFLATRSARRLKLRSTGNANGAYNLQLTSRIDGGDRDAMRRRLYRGLVVTDLLGGATDPVTGNWTRAVAGQWVEGGEIVHPVRDVTLAGRMPAMLRGVVAVGDDVERFGLLRTGSILIDEMQLGGAA